MTASNPSRTCKSDVDACVAAGGTRRTCKRTFIRSYRTTGVAVCRPFG